MNDDQDDITLLLHQVGAGDEAAKSRLMDAVYPELQRIASRIFRAERTGHSLEPAALIADVWMRILNNKPSIAWRNRTHFYCLAARTMRNALVDYARSKNAQRRPKGKDRMPLEDVVAFSDDRLQEVLEVSEALARLGERHQQAADVVELRYYGGYTLEEIAKTLDVSLTTAKNRHEFAMSWLESFMCGTPLE